MRAVISSQPLILLLCGAVLLASVRSEAQVERFVIGDEGHPWEEWGAFDALDGLSLPGSVQPRRTTSQVNILRELRANGRLFVGEKPSADSGYRPGRDGRIWSLNIPVTENPNLFLLADGLADTVAFDYFDRISSNAGVSIVVDLGLPFPVNEISFYPLSFGRHIELYVRGYELFANDGSPEKVDERGGPVFTLLAENPTNVDVVVRDRGFSPQHIRYIKLRITAPQPFELDQLEVRGEGFVRRAVFTSREIDLGDIANFGRLFWGGIEEPGTELDVQTRIRWDSDRDWTDWSPPYPASGGKVAAGGPGQFVQIRATFDTSVPEARARLDSLAFEYSRPVMARRVVGRISPREGVDLGNDQRFTYALFAEIDDQDIGFDTVRLAVPSSASLQEVRIADKTLSHEAYAVQGEKDFLSVRLLEREDRIGSSTEALELVFNTSMLVYGTVFSGEVSASWATDLLPQLIEEKDAGDLVVQGSERSLGVVLGKPAALPEIFTPNGDGINDRTAIAFRLSQVIGLAPLTVRVYDLAGRFRATLLDDLSGSDSFRLEWDGRDEEGLMVPPGLYVYRVELKGDVGTFAKIGAVGVVY